MLDHLLGGGTAEDMPVEAWRAEVRVPPGGFAETRLRVETRLLVEFARAVGEEFGDTIPEAQEVSLRVGRHELAGRTVPCGPLGPVLYRPGGARPKDEFALWVELLVAAAARRARPDPGGPFEARLLHISDGKAASTAYAEPENPEALLGVLLEAFVHAERFPIPLLPGAGLAYARQVKHGREAALRAALDAWTGNDFAKADSEDPYAELCFGHDPVGGRFGEIAEAVFVPMHAARVDRRRAKDGESRTSRRGKAGR
jgi:exonuclease V gamma subunit